MNLDKRKMTCYYFVVLFLGAIIYYIFPIFFNSNVLTMGLLFFINPIYNIVSCLLFTVKFGLHVDLSINLAILFIPSVFFFYGVPFLYYCVCYGLAAIVGCCAGYPIYKRYQQ